MIKRRTLLKSLILGSAMAMPIHRLGVVDDGISTLTSDRSYSDLHMSFAKQLNEVTGLPVYLIQTGQSNAI